MVDFLPTKASVCLTEVFYLKGIYSDIKSLFVLRCPHFYVRQFNRKDFSGKAFVNGVSFRSGRCPFQSGLTLLQFQHRVQWFGYKSSFPTDKMAFKNTSKLEKHNSVFCRKTAVCIRDQLLDFSVPELVLSQSTFSIVPEVLQNCTGFTCAAQQVWQSANFLQ